MNYSNLTAEEKRDKAIDLVNDCLIPQIGANTLIHELLTCNNSTESLNNLLRIAKIYDLQIVN
jgi:hypothetical protein